MTVPLSSLGTSGTFDPDDVPPWEIADDFAMPPQEPIEYVTSGKPVIEAPTAPPSQSGPFFGNPVEAVIVTDDDIAQDVYEQRQQAAKAGDAESILWVQQYEARIAKKRLQAQVDEDQYRLTLGRKRAVKRVEETEALQNRVSWADVELDDILNGTHRKPVPSIGCRSDGVPFLYPGREHAVAAEPEAGKTWFALMLVVHCLAAGQRVVYVDFEDDAVGIVSRLLAMGVPAQRLRKETGLFQYKRPESPGLAADVHAMAQGVALVVFDGVTEAYGLHGWKIIDNDDAAKYRQTYIRPCLDAGAATLSTDHIPKDAESSVRTAIGGQHKFAGLNGVMFKITNDSPFGQGRVGRSRISITKDRPGALRQHGLSTYPDGKSMPPGVTFFAELVGDASSGDMREVELYAPGGVPSLIGAASKMQVTSGPAPSGGLTVVEKRILEHLAKNAADALERKRVIEQVQGKGADIIAGLASLAARGLIVNYPPDETCKANRYQFASDKVDQLPL